METPLYATIKVPLQSMLPPEVFTKMMDYAQREKLEPGDVMVQALVAYMPKMVPPPPAELAQAS